MTMKTVIIIPSRLASTRLPEKPLALINGKPMVEQTFDRAMESKMGKVVVATCSEIIKKIIEDRGGTAIVTDPNLATGTDRAYAALMQLGESYDYVVNLQGDLPTIQPPELSKVLLPFEHLNVDIGTLCAPMMDVSEVMNVNVVKAVLGGINNGVARALYFSRNPVPHNANPLYHHVGVYAYKIDALHRFVKLPQGYLELQEKLEQLRALEDGMTMGAAIVHTTPVSVDMASDLEKARAFFK
jgi:3-deoxy-manno-octulosonate cytidylyltransferase (CMP-KDO synthetase)